MNKKKELPKVNTTMFQINPSLGQKKYKLTQDSQAFRDKIADFVKKNRVIETKRESVS